MSSSRNASTIPTHIAIVCDGNRRWAQAHGLEVFKGHDYAFRTIFEPLADQAILRGVKYLTFWIFSTDNWQRPRQEVDYLMNLFRSVFDEKVEKLHQKGVKIKAIGRLTDFDQDIQDKLAEVIAKTANNTNLTLTFAMSYGGRDELTRACQKIAAQVAEGNLLPSDITPQVISQNLDTAGTPDPDLVIRTSGELRTSGYLLWQADYAEYWFPEFHFPEFTPQRFDEALAEFARRQRRYGK